jgi:hypothetical protein
MSHVDSLSMYILIVECRAAVAKEVTSMAASSISAYFYLRSDMSQSTSLWNHFGFRTCLLWSALQLFRLFIHHFSMAGVFSEDIGAIVILVVTLSEKVAGSVFECSRVQIEAAWLLSVSVRAAPPQIVRSVVSPVFWMSVSEVLSNISGNLIKFGIDMADLANHFFCIALALLFFLSCTVCLQVFMIQGILNKKLD